MNKIKNLIKSQVILLVCFFSFIYTYAQPKYLTKNAEISVLTCGTGAEAYTLFGHTALRIKDTDQHLDVVYNWGMFDFKTPGFYAKFIKGDLLYYLDVDQFEDFVYGYTIDGREVIEQQLNLSDDQKVVLWDEINRQLKSNERFYTYGFIQNNCTTKVVDVLNKVFEKPLKIDFPSNSHSFRYILNEGLSHHYFEKLGINLLFGYPTNQQNNLLFLPVKLKESISYDKTILKKQYHLNNIITHDESNGINSIYTLWVIVLILGIAVFHRKVRFIYFLITALFSLFLIAVGLFTKHPELHFNALILFFNPVFFLALVFKNRRVLFLAVFLSLISLFFMGIELMMIIMPLILLNFLYMLALFLKKEKES